jgi:hypothetical protein
MKKTLRMVSFLAAAVATMTASAFADQGTYICKNLDSNGQPGFVMIITAPTNIIMGYATDTSNQGSSASDLSDPSDAQVQYFKLHSTVAPGVANFTEANVVYNTDAGKTLQSVTVQGPDANGKTVAVTYRDCSPVNN